MERSTVYVCAPRGAPEAGDYAAALEQAGLRPWLFEDEVFPGVDEVKAREEAIAASEGALVLLAERWEDDPWARDVLGVLLDRMVVDGRFVVPVDLGGRVPEPLRARGPRRMSPAEAAAFARRHARGRAAPVTAGRTNLPRWGNIPLVGRARELRSTRRALDATGAAVIAGASGVGKTAVARFTALTLLPERPGGCWWVPCGRDPIVDLVEVLRGAGVPGAPWEGFPAHDRARAAWRALRGGLVVLDNIAHEAQLGGMDGGWLPNAGEDVLVLITSTYRMWSPGWSTVEVAPLDEADAGVLVEAISGADPTDERVREVVRIAEGLPVALHPLATVVRDDQLRRRRRPVARGAASDATRASLERAWQLLTEEGRNALVAAAHLRPDALSERALEALTDGAIDCERAVDELVDRGVLTPASEGRWRIHRLHRDAVHALAELADCAALAGRHLDLLVAAAGAVVDARWDDDTEARFLELLPEDPLPHAAAVRVAEALSTVGRFEEAEAWARAAAAALDGPARGEAWGEAACHLGDALLEQGRFEDGHDWFVRAVEARARGDEAGRRSGEGEGVALAGVGVSLMGRARFDEARPWFERAVAAKERGDVNGRVSVQSVGVSLHQVGYCLFEQGRFEEAPPWFERAVAAAERGDVNGRVSGDLLGRSLHEVGCCLLAQGRYEDARPWFERAVAAMERGDVLGRVSGESVGASLHQVGYCLSEQGRYEDARPWFERAVAAAERGDVLGRVSWDSLGVSLHQVGYCLSAQGRYEDARPWLERAVAAKERGDVLGRVSGDSVGVSLHQVGYCLSEQGRFEEARPWFERAVAAMERGDVLGRVSGESVGASLHQVGYCLSEQGRYEDARPWFERAVAAMERGDVLGRVSGESVGASLHQVGYCLSEQGRYEDARPWFERAVAAGERGDVLGRVDHATVGRSRALVGLCDAKRSRLRDARRELFTAARELREGDRSGQVPTAELRMTLGWLADVCEAAGDRRAAARHRAEAAALEDP